MFSQNRQCFFFTENRPSYGDAAETTLSWKNTRNYMNKMTVNEHDQFEICGILPINMGKLNKERKEEKKYIPSQILNILSTASGIVDVLISGLSLCKYFRLYEGPLGMGLIFKYLQVHFYFKSQPGKRHASARL